VQGFLPTRDCKFERVNFTAQSTVRVKVGMYVTTLIHYACKKLSLAGRLRTRLRATDQVALLPTISLNNLVITCIV